MSQIQNPQIIFGVNGKITIINQETAITYTDLDELLCMCVMFDGEFPENKDQYRTLYEMYRKNCNQCSNSKDLFKLNENGQQMRNLPTEARELIQEEFDSLSLESKYGYIEAIILLSDKDKEELLKISNAILIEEQNLENSGNYNNNISKIMTLENQRKNIYQKYCPLEIL